MTEQEAEIIRRASLVEELVRTPAWGLIVEEARELQIEAARMGKACPEHAALYMGIVNGALDLTSRLTGYIDSKREILASEAEAATERKARPNRPECGTRSVPHTIG